MIPAAGGIQVQPGVTFGPQRAREIRGAATVTAAHFQNLFPRQRNLRGDVMIKLDARAIFFIVRREREVHGRLRLERVVQKQNFLAVQPPREKRIPQPPDGLADSSDGKKRINDRHAAVLRKARGKPILFSADAEKNGLVSRRELRGLQSGRLQPGSAVVRTHSIGEQDFQPDGWFGCRDAEWSGLYDRMHTHEQDEPDRRLALAADYGEAL